MAFTRGHALIIGVGTYTYTPEMNLPITAADAEAVATVLRNPAYCGYPDSQVILLHDSTATREGIMAALDTLAARAGQDATIVLFYSGHGHTGTDGNYYLTTHDTRLTAGQVTPGTGVSETDLIAKLRNLPAQRMLILINACHAGELSPVLVPGQPPFTGTPVPEKTAATLLATGTGRVIITACREDQYAYTGNGSLTLFTQALVHGLQGKGDYVSNHQGFISVFDLYNHLYDTIQNQVAHHIPANVRQRYSAVQEPELTVLKGMEPFAVALYRGATALGEFQAPGYTPEEGAVNEVDEERHERLAACLHQQIIEDVAIGDDSQGDMTIHRQERHHIARQGGMHSNMTNLLLDYVDTLHGGFKQIAMRLVAPDTAESATSMAALLVATMLLACRADSRARRALRQDELQHWLGASWQRHLQRVDLSSEAGWQRIRTLAVIIRQRCAEDHDLADEIANLLVGADAVDVIFEHIRDQPDADLTLLRRFRADLLDDACSLEMYPPPVCRSLLKPARQFIETHTSPTPAPHVQVVINEVMMLWALLTQRARKPVPSVPLHRRIDAAAPSAAQVGQVFDLLVQVQLPDAPPLTREYFPERRRPAEIVTDTEPLALEFPVDAASGRVGSTYVDLVIIAPDCRVESDMRPTVEVPAGHNSALVFFLVRPLRPGLSQINVNVEVHRVNRINLGTIPVDVQVSGDPVENPPLQTASLHILVSHMTVVNAQGSQGNISVHQQTISGNAQVGAAVAGDVHGNISVDQHQETLHAPGAQGLIAHASGPVSQHFGEQLNIHTGGGDYAAQNIDFRGDTITLGNVQASDAIAVGQGAIAMAMKVGVNPAPTNPREQRNRSRMLARIRDFWVTGVLEASLHGAPMIELQAEFQPRAVEGVIGRSIDALEQCEAQYWNVTEIAAKCNQEGCGLLILGAPGAGKTTMLLALAQTLLDQAEQDATLSMPVIFNLSTWARKRMTLDTWLVEELNLRYDVPHRVAHAWIQRDQVLPLLDGLDEVPAADRAACVAAINGFRREHGLIGMVVCCWDAQFKELVVQHKVFLHLHGALLLQPLTAAQIDTYMAHRGPALKGLSTALQQDHMLRELAETPLMLNVLTRAYKKLSVSELQQLPSITERRQLLFSTYVQHMLVRPGADPHYTPAQTYHWLAHLAREMRHHALPMFFVERLQPEVLSGSMLRQYTLFDRLGVGLIAGVLMGLFAGVVCTLCLNIPPFLPTQARSMGLVNAMVFLFVFGLIGGLFGGKGDVQTHAPHDLWWLSRSAILGWLVVGGVAGAAGALGVALRPELRIPWYVWGMAFWMTTGLLGLLVGGLAGYPGLHRRRIGVVEKLNWSRGTQALRSMLLALGIGLLYGLIYQLSVGAHRTIGIVLAEGVVFSFIIGLISWLGGGLAGNELEQKVFPNQGMWRSANNALASGLVVGLSTALVVGVGASLIFWFGVQMGPVRGSITGLAFGLVYGGSVGIIVGLVFGGYACLSHIMLRFVLWRSGWIPWNYVRFLDHSAERILLRKVGGGYMFIHRLLMDYFAELGEEKNIAPE